MSESALYDVVILGLGPVGATLANLLGQRGHKVAIAEIHDEVYDKPRAINLDQEALRLWQRIGLAADIAKDAAHHPGTDFLGADGELIKAIYSAPPPYPMGWPANLMFIQPEAEQQLRDRIATFKNVDVFLRYTAVALKQSADDVSVTCDTPEGQKALRARFCIGCDGANSATRQWLGITQTDLGFSEYYVVVDAWLTDDTPLPPRTTQYCFPQTPTSYIVCSGNLRRWELKILPEENVEDYDDIEKIKQRLAPFVDTKVLKFWRSAVYHFNARVADRWRDRRVFLAGDAAHTMPPFLGQGLNSGLRDAANLAWKLSYVLDLKAPETLLDTYQSERRPHILTLTEITKELGQIVGETNPEKAALRDKRLRAEMIETGAVTVRQSLIPSLDNGFLYSNGGKLAGHMMPQPTVVKLNSDSHFLMDDLLSGFALIRLDPHTNTITITNDVETGYPSTIKCKIIEDPISDFMSDNFITSIIVRPDGVIWSTSAGEMDEGINRLQASLKLSTAEYNS